jgi:hypothetical protein
MVNAPLRSDINGHEEASLSRITNLSPTIKYRKGAHLVELPIAG